MFCSQTLEGAWPLPVTHGVPASREAGDKMQSYPASKRERHDCQTGTPVSRTKHLQLEGGWEGFGERTVYCDF